MEIDKILVFVSGIIGVVFIAWFFFGKKEEIIEAGDTIRIAVKGGYNPSTIQLKKGKKTTVTFRRSDPSSCLEEVVLPDFKIRKFLPLNETVSVEITPQKIGEFPFACGMNMFHGRIIVR